MSANYDPRFFRRQDESPDSGFYWQPRFTVHIDDGAIAAVTALYRELLPSGGAILDLMSSWRSHLPEDVAFSRVVGLGMNAAEMADNPQLTGYLVHDLNVEPLLPFEDGSFDGCCLTVSIQYLIRPVEVFREVHRVLRPGAPFAITFSNRCFPTKAVAVWLAGDDAEHIRLVRNYFETSGGWQDLTDADRSDRSDPWSDPLFAVWARKAIASA